MSQSIPIFPVLPPRITSLPVYVTEVCLGYEEGNMLFRPEGYDSCQLSVCISGSGVFVCGGQSYQIRPGDLFFFSDQVPHRYYPNGEETWMLDWVTFRTHSPELFPGKGHFVCRCTGLSIPQRIREIHGLLSSPGLYPQLEASRLIYQCITELLEESARAVSSDPARETSALDRVIRYMGQHFAEDLSVSRLAELIGVSPSYLCRRFKRTYHLSPLQYLILLRISKAKEFMQVYPDRTVREIGRMCGYHDCAYFGAEFKRITGMTPMSFRKPENL